MFSILIGVTVTYVNTFIRIHSVLYLRHVQLTVCEYYLDILKYDPKVIKIPLYKTICGRNVYVYVTLSVMEGVYVSQVLTFVLIFCLKVSN